MSNIFNNFKEFKTFEVSFTNDIGKVNQLPCIIESVEGDIIVITTDIDEKIPRAKIGEILHIRIFSDTGVYTATSSVLERVETPNRIEYSIDLPTEINHSQRREYYRTEMAVDVKVTVTNNSNGNEITIEGKTKNISGRGMCFAANENIYNSENSNISVLLNFEDKTISTEANLVYTKEYLSSYGDTLYLHAFYFTTISQNDIDYIVKKCFLHQLELRKKNNV